jgi:hypothetical protein
MRTQTVTTQAVTTEANATKKAVAPQTIECTETKTHPLFEVISLDPEYGKNYDIGYIGFTYSATNFVSNGIAYFTRWSRMSQIKTCHALLVTGENECIEAHAQGGVKKTPLSNYFNDVHTQIFFRKPLDLTDAIAKAIVITAQHELGCKYDTKLIASQALSNSHLGKLIKDTFGGKPEEIISKLMNNDNRWICSELVAYCLDEQPLYKGRGILGKPADTIDPQELFEDSIIFQPWINSINASDKQNAFRE